jgi:hypothetical protein
VKLVSFDEIPQPEMQTNLCRLTGLFHTWSGQVKNLMRRGRPCGRRKRLAAFVEQLVAAAGPAELARGSPRDLLFLLQPAQELGFAFGVGPDGSRGLAEQVNGARGLAKVRKAIRTLVRNVLPDDPAGLARQRSK